MRLRDHDKADLALAALTLSVSTVAAGYQVARWVADRRRRPAARRQSSRRAHT